MLPSSVQARFFLFHAGRGGGQFKRDCKDKSSLLFQISVAFLVQVFNFIFGSAENVTRAFFCLLEIVH